MAAQIDLADDGELEPTLRNLMEMEQLQWVFVGGKGGVGKTTVSCTTAVALAAVRESVLVVSTDPAHNLSDAFAQKFDKEPTLVNGFDNLYCMEIEASQGLEAFQQQQVVEAEGIGADGAGKDMQSFMMDMASSLPGIDEAMSFAELMKQVQSMDYSVVVFDTAPTGHTLRLLSFPTTLEKAMGKIVALKNKFGGLFNQVSAMLGNQMPPQEMLLGRLEETREVIARVNTLFKDAERTTFVCVCIPEFLSLYETERLVQELTKFGIDTHNIVVNQCLFPEQMVDDLESWYETARADLSTECNSIVSKFLARKRMQDKYVGQIFDLYEDFHVVLLPLLDAEVRGVDALKHFSRHLMYGDEEDEEDFEDAAADGDGET
mmetsp:Transcript_9876/g.29036  ORF Transcript_9876/g.29036 Transcript_9876/m.29036 type:complete len:376 (-) Transcript_9876:57-1184(-)|eukprot:CAMPEP_0118867950 /NCGR_PEP_ID=MMETSP1163-20130328/11404_1 /TAXON_ID=124430 /ORGANISM="Phaeomonas parva, Strain CCMP2877" /LENGTH=375 /DNA_ID=CAMNT_0006802449 /DNA_START=234 /DNA_END=1361 /DNA_ORIENTATION=+